MKTLREESGKWQVLRPLKANIRFKVKKGSDWKWHVTHPEREQPGWMLKKYELKFFLKWALVVRVAFQSSIIPSCSLPFINIQSFRNYYWESRRQRRRLTTFFFESRPWTVNSQTKFAKFGSPCRWSGFVTRVRVLFSFRWRFFVRLYILSLGKLTGDCQPPLMLFHFYRIINSLREEPDEVLELKVLGCINLCLSLHYYDGGGSGVAQIRIPG